MDIYSYRPLVIFLIEIALVFYVYKNGVYLKHWIITFLIFLAGYQLGEFIYFATAPSEFGITLAYISTSFLPIIGLIGIQKVSEVRFKGTYLLFAIPLVYSLLFIFNPTILEVEEVSYCFAKVINGTGNKELLLTWFWYYVGVLTLSTLLVILLIVIKKGKQRRRLLVLLATYFSFFPTSVILIHFFNIPPNYGPSFMCSMAIFAAFFATFLSTYKPK